MISISGKSAEKYSAQSPVASDLNSTARKLQRKDPKLWGEAAATEAANRLNWINLPVTSRELLPQLDALSAWARSKNLSNLILCGMGGSSLAPEVMAKAYGKTLITLDTTDPEQIKLAVPKRLEETLIIVGSKSGSTIETASQKSFFEDLFLSAGLDPTNHFVIVTDPDSPLDTSARASKFRVINADPSVGGRFSALSAFGLVPAALLGIDVSVLLDDADVASKKFSEPNSPAVKLATLIFEQSSQNFALIDNESNVPGIGDWIEQLVAESTGKNQKGRLPIVIESTKAPIGGSALSIGFAEGVSDVNVVATLGEHFILWEWVTALLCRALEVDPFNQPNVTEAKERTSELLNQWRGNGVPEIAPAYENSSLAIFTKLPCPDLRTVLAKFIDCSSEYFAVMAYLNRELDLEVIKVRSALASKTNRGVTFGWGPRFLHSTGQFHKGGQQNGSFLQITGDSERDLKIPGRDFTFHTLLMAQALGDGEALTSRNLPMLRIHLKNRKVGINEILEAISKL
jgi:glucose-6-phosphate isomerase